MAIKNPVPEPWEARRYTLERQGIPHGGSGPRAAGGIAPAGPRAGWDLEMRGSQPQFTFRVPVQVKDLHPEVSHVLALCWVGKSANMDRWMTNATVAMKPVPVNALQGSLNKTVILTLHQVDDPQAMTHYRCRMHASQGGPGGRDFEYGDGDDWNHVKPGTPLITQIDAALP